MKRDPAWFVVGARVVLDSTYRPAPLNGIPTTIVAIRPNSHGHRLAELELTTRTGQVLLVHSWELADESSPRAQAAIARRTERLAIT